MIINFLGFPDGRAHIVGKGRILEQRRRFDPQGGTAVIGSTRGGSHRPPLTTRRRSSARRLPARRRSSARPLAARRRSSARHGRLSGSPPGPAAAAVVGSSVIGSPRGAGAAASIGSLSGGLWAAASRPVFPSEAGIGFCGTTVMVVPGPLVGLCDSDRAREVGRVITAGLGNPVDNLSYGVKRMVCSGVGRRERPGCSLLVACQCQ